MSGGILVPDGSGHFKEKVPQFDPENFDFSKFPAEDGDLFLIRHTSSDPEVQGEVVRAWAGLARAYNDMFGKSITFVFIPETEKPSEVMDRMTPQQMNQLGWVRRSRAMEVVHRQISTILERLEDRRTTMPDKKETTALLRTALKTLGDISGID